VSEMQYVYVSVNVVFIAPAKVAGKISVTIQIERILVRDSRLGLLAPCCVLGVEGNRCDSRSACADELSDICAAGVDHPYVA